MVFRAQPCTAPTLSLAPSAECFLCRSTVILFLPFFISSIHLDRTTANMAHLEHPVLFHRFSPLFPSPLLSSQLPLVRSCIHFPVYFCTLRTSLCSPCLYRHSHLYSLVLCTLPRSLETALSGKQRDLRDTLTHCNCVHAKALLICSLLSFSLSLCPSQRSSHQHWLSSLCKSLHQSPC